ncbi:MAG TPA: TonB-dependent receptor [Chitinophagaceae bacterium]|nr:TonB-dependent receptor [Chitinophagaceae bacterium]HNA19186.1 TonB-dependent receptor [Chitinophagaceae bacterium]HNA90730.1 TonB-dependent receptor [Chitinophagaceae bacterium]HNA95593.1 TonB-dependent receptor [Chitinophagaceae bacterium]HNC38578.1 TonB-dependent receptor [Chitinophagaceae bacterium]
MKKHFFVLAAVIISNQLIAQDTARLQLDEVVVTANKYEQKQSTTGKVLNIISRQQLERSGGKTLCEVLNTLPGLTMIGANNVLGTNQNISIRGASAGNVLLLIDGIPVNDPSAITNYYDLNFINIDQVERIEVLKGGQSTLYGSDAVAGAINVILKKADKKITVFGGVTGGSYNTLKESIGFGGQQKNTHFSINYTHQSSDGFSAATDKNKVGGFDNDGFKQHALNGRFEFSPAKNLKINFTGTYNNYFADLDAAAFTDEKDYTVKNDNKQLGASAVYTLKKTTIHLNYNFNHVIRRYNDDSLYQSSPYSKFARSSYTGRTQFAELYGNWKINNFELLIGADYRWNNTDQWYWSTGAFGPYAPPALHAEMKQVSPYLTLAYNQDNGFGAEIGGRYNDHSVYGNNVSFNFNPFFVIKDKAKLFANIYSAFKTPTLYQLYDQSIGNSSLTPEKSTVAEAGVKFLSLKKLNARVVGFYRQAKDAILYTFNPSTFAGKYLNASKQTNYGIELEGGFAHKKVSITANYTYTNGKTTAAFDGTGAPLSKDTTYYNLYRIPKHTIHIDFGVQATPTIYCSIKSRSASKREEYVYGAAAETLKAYVVFDVYGEYKMGKETRLFLEINNIAGNKYVDILGYNNRGFNFNTGINFRL